MQGLELMQGVTERGNAPALTDTEGPRAMAEVQAAVVMAKRFPRDQKQAYDRTMLACQRPSLAETAIYEYARGGTAISGPSIRMAEALAQNWGNIQFGIRELEQREGESTVEAYAWDIETNTRQTKTFQVPHKRHTKKGSYSLEDPRDIYELVANNGARRLRACILGVIPGDIVDAAVAQCEETLKAKADTSPDAVKKLVEAFKVFGATREHLEKRLQRNIDAITPAQIVGMRKIYNSLKDGMSSAADWFEVETQKEAVKGVDGLKARLAGKKDEGVPAKTFEPKPTADTSPATEGIKSLLAAQSIQTINSMSDPLDFSQSPTRERIEKKKEEAFEFRYFDIVTEINEAKVSTALDLIQKNLDGVDGAETRRIPADYAQICEMIALRRKVLAGKK